MLDKVVFHIKYGVGNIINLTSDTITVEFQDFGVKTFPYPDSFTSFLEFEDSTLQKQALQDFEQKNNESKILAASYQGEMQKLVFEVELLKQKQQRAKTLKGSLKKYLESKNLYSQFKLAKSVLTKNKLSQLLLKENILNNPDILDCLYSISENSSNFEILKSFEKYIQ